MLILLHRFVSMYLIRFFCLFFFSTFKGHSGKIDYAFFFNAVLWQLTRSTAVALGVAWNREMLHCRLYLYAIVMNFAMTLVIAALTSMNCKCFKLDKIVSNH